MKCKCHFSWQAQFGEVLVSLFVAGAVLGEGQVSLFVACAVLGVKFAWDFPWQAQYLVKCK